MRIMTGHSKTNTTYHIIRDVNKNGKRSTEIVENLGSSDEICKKYGVKDAKAWADEYLEKLKAEQANINHTFMVPFDAEKKIASGEQLSFNAGYLFLQRIYYQLGIPTICKNIKKNYSFEYDLNAILSRLVYCRILHPASKRSSYEHSKRFLEPRNFKLHQVYRSLSVLAENFDYIQSELYKKSKRVIKRSTGVLYYDCTNFFFEIEQEEDNKKYGPSKEHRPNPIVQMGLFMDRSGMPLAFNINAGNQNEQLSLKPLEEKLMSDFELSKFVVCTDAGLSSDENKKYNNFGERSFITTQSIKKLDEEKKKWCLDPKGWHLDGTDRVFDISNLDDTEENEKKTFYKQLYVEGYDEKRDIEFNQTLIVTFSLKYKKYQRSVRDRQIERAKKMMENPSSVDKKRQNDAKRFIKKTNVTKYGEVAGKAILEIDQSAIAEEEKYDGFYAVYTNLDDDPAEIARINHYRWEIEESFRIMKTEFEARPVYVKRDDRIKAHFLTCFISLMIYRVLEKQLDERYTCEELIHTMQDMNMRSLGENGYIPAYTRTSITDALHKNAGFETDFEILRPRKMAGVIRRSKGL